MWKKRVLALLLCAGVAGQLTPGLAAEPAGLAAFRDQKSYTEGVFTDVAASDWYAPGVEKVYTKGIMEGTGTGVFAPGSTVTWSQAVTIAARLHGTYHGKEIPQMEGPWYERYLRYAEDQGLLPGFCPQAADSETIPREGMALLFAEVLEEKDLPAVNDQTIPDLAQAREDCREAVKRMYAAGIITGKEGGAFDPKGKATRGEMATIVTRLLCPGRRVSHDSRTNPNMADQMGNYHSGGIAIRRGDRVYYLHKGQVNESKYEYTVTERTDGGELRVVYTTEWALFRLAVGPDDALYVIGEEPWEEGKDPEYRLYRLDTETGRTETLYTTYSEISSYQFYDGQLYVGEGDRRSDAPDRWRYQIGEVTGGKMKPLVKDLTFDEQGFQAVADFYISGGRLYYTLCDPKSDENVTYSLDMKGGSPERLFGDGLAVAYQGETYWRVSGGYGKPILLSRGLLALPEAEEQVAVLPSEVTGERLDIYVNGDQLYLNACQTQKLWALSQEGKEELLANLSSVYVEHSTVTSQGILLHALDNVANLYAQGIKVLPPEGEKVNQSVFLGRPYCTKGRDKFKASEGADWDLPAPEADIQIEPLRAYLTPERGGVLEVWVRNGLDTEAELHLLQVKATGFMEAERCFSIVDNDFLTLSPGEEQVLSMVFPQGSYGDNAQEDEVSVELQVTYDS